MSDLLIATTNPAKLTELSNTIQAHLPHISILTLHDKKHLPEPIEDGKTFEENAKIKAQFYGNQTKLPTVADDGGIEIVALDGAPGVRSRRWPGYTASDKELIDFTLEKMKHIPKEKRQARLTTCVCFYDITQNVYHCQQASLEGYISTKPYSHYTQGYPYRALFIVKQYNIWYDELSSDQHNAINHRIKAVHKLIPYLSI